MSCDGIEKELSSCSPYWAIEHHSSRDIVISGSRFARATQIWHPPTHHQATARCRQRNIDFGLPPIDLYHYSHFHCFAKICTVSLQEEGFGTHSSQSRLQTNYWTYDFLAQNKPNMTGQAFVPSNSRRDKNTYFH